MRKVFLFFTPHAVEKSLPETAHVWGEPERHPGLLGTTL